MKNPSLYKYREIKLALTNNGDIKRLGSESNLSSANSAHDIVVGEKSMSAEQDLSDLVHDERDGIDHDVRALDAVSHELLDGLLALVFGPRVDHNHVHVGELGARFEQDVRDERRVAVHHQAVVVCDLRLGVRRA